MQPSFPADDLESLDPPGSDGGGGGGEDLVLPILAPYKIENNVEDPCIATQVNNAINADFKNKTTQLVWDAFGESENFDIHIEAYDIKNYDLDGDVFPSVTLEKITFMMTLNTGALASPSKEYILTTTFHELLHAYMGYLDLESSNNSTDHEDMADNYLHMLADALMEHYIVSQTDAIRLAWGGLYETDKWNGLSSTKKNQIIQTNSQYKTGQKGTPC